MQTLERNQVIRSCECCVDSDSGNCGGPEAVCGCWQASHKLSRELGKKFGCQIPEQLYIWPSYCRKQSVCLTATGVSRRSMLDTGETMGSGGQLLLRS